jgi:hypothetical protein
MQPKTQLKRKEPQNMTVYSTSVVLLWIVSTCVSGEVGAVDTKRVSRSVAIDPQPTTLCNKDNQGEVWTSPHNTPISTIWICHNSRWIPHMVTPSTGKTPQVAGMSCKDIRDTLTTDCSGPPPTGAYWVNVTDSHCCCGPEDDHQHQHEDQSIKVYCEMSMDGGGWTLVWKHSYLEVGPLNDNMKYFSNHYRPCTDIESGWCNVPYKCRLKPTEMMIVAYRNKTPRFAYKGWFNYNIDCNWRGGILVEPKKILDQCTFTSHTANKEPAPSAHKGDRRLLGIAFDKRSPTNYLVNCVTIGGQFTAPWDCRWADCDNWGSVYAKTQMTMAIYVR